MKYIHLKKVLDLKFFVFTTNFRQKKASSQLSNEFFAVIYFKFSKFYKL